MADRIYHEEGTNRFIEVSSTLQNEIVQYALENDLKLRAAAEEYLPKVLSGEGETGEESDE